MRRFNTSIRVRNTTIVLGCSLLLVCLVLVSSSALGQTEHPGTDHSQAQADNQETAGAGAGWGAMDAEKREKTIAYSSIKHIFYFVGTAYSAIVLVVLLFSGFSARMLGWAKRVTRARVFVLLIYVGLFLLITTLASLPLTYYLDFHLDHQFELSNQSLGDWALDGLKELAIEMVLVSLVIGILYALIRARPRSWWAWFGVGAVPFLVLLIVVAPVVITPMFYDVKPMPEGQLSAQILDLAARSGIENSRVFELDASRDTKKLNAYVTGLGRTKRIVLYDNLIKEMSPAEAVFVVGHEMAHYLLHHVWIGLSFAIATVFIIGFLSSLIMSKIIAVNQARFGFDRLSSLASLPLVALCFLIFGFLLSPIQNGLWRHFEHQADVYGLNKTGNATAAVGAFEKIAAVNLSDPNPSSLVKFWLYDHPTLSERVQFAQAFETAEIETDPFRMLGERHLANLKQLTFGGENAEAYFDLPGERLVFQSTRDGYDCDRIFTMGADGSDLTQVSVPGGVTTCAFFSPDGERVIYCSTYLVDDSCPPKPSHSQGYVWALYPGYDVFSAKADGSDLKRLTNAPGYDAEAVFAPDGSKILFTSARDGDLELYTMNPDGSDQTRLTFDVGYDGGAFYSADSKRIVYRAHHPTTEEAIADYQRLLGQDLIRPSQLEIFVMDADGSNRTQVTSNGAANFCPFFHPNGKQIIFTSNMDDPQKRDFELYLINIDGTGLERITYNDTFDGFPMFSADGKTLVFCSNRQNAKHGETNTFVADWID